MYHNIYICICFWEDAFFNIILEKSVLGDYTPVKLAISKNIYSTL